MLLCTVGNIAFQLTEFSFFCFPFLYVVIYVPTVQKEKRSSENNVSQASFVSLTSATKGKNSPFMGHWSHFFGLRLMLVYWMMDLGILFGFIWNKKVLLRERKRHTARRVVSTPSVVLTGYPPPSSSGWGGGTLPGYPPGKGTTPWGVSFLGTPPPGQGTPPP